MVAHCNGYVHRNSNEYALKLKHFNLEGRRFWNLCYSIYYFLFIYIAVVNIYYCVHQCL